MSQLPIPLSISLYVNTRMKATGLKLTEAEKWMFWTGTTTDQLEERKAVRCDTCEAEHCPGHVTLPRILFWKKRGLGKHESFPCSNWRVIKETFEERLIAGS